MTVDQLEAGRPMTEKVLWTLPADHVGQNVINYDNQSASLAKIRGGPFARRTYVGVAIRVVFWLVFVRMCPRLALTRLPGFVTIRPLHLWSNRKERPMKRFGIVLLFLFSAMLAGCCEPETQPVYYPMYYPSCPQTCVPGCATCSPCTPVCTSSCSSCTSGVGATSLQPSAANLPPSLPSGPQQGYQGAGQ
jgi:hypothetical protein